LPTRRPFVTVIVVLVVFELSVVVIVVIIVVRIPINALIGIVVPFVVVAEIVLRVGGVQQRAD
jgi:hypothetical protein